MYSFVVLLPLTLIMAVLGGILIVSPQLRDYAEFVASLGDNPDWIRLPVQIVVHIATYAVICFVLVATTRTISAPVSRDRPEVLCRVQMALEAIFVAVPSITIVTLATYSMVDGAKAKARTQSALAPELMFNLAAIIAAAALLVVVLSGRPREPRRFGLALVAIVAGFPIVFWLTQLVMAFASGSVVRPLLTLAAAVGAIGLAASVATVVLVRYPLELFRSTLRPLYITLADRIAGLALGAWIAVGVSLAWQPVGSAAFLGILPVLFLVSSVALICFAGIFAKGSSPVAIVSIAISAMVIMHGLDSQLPTREFRYTFDIPAELKDRAEGKTKDRSTYLSPREVTKARDIMDLREAFLAWLQARKSAIEAYRDKKKAYPVLVVSAQGGGIYAAYHSALSLARLYDACPEIVNHMFVLNGVSGGSLGAAVFTELVRSVPEKFRVKPGDEAKGCNPHKAEPVGVDQDGPGAPKLEKLVQQFFAANFLSPLVDSALLFDIPSLLMPWLRFGMDRAYALEYAFEAAWVKMAKEKRASKAKDWTPPYGPEANFYGRWRPDGPVPALFLNTISVNSGVPVLVSQIKWEQGQGAPKPSRKLDDPRWLDAIRMLLSQGERIGGSVVGNILDFRPDLQMPTSTAVALSARFPYVTPPANIDHHHRIVPSEIFSKIGTLQLLDGGYFDNSGGWIAIELLDALERYLEPPIDEPLKELVADVRFHLVRFTDRTDQMQRAVAAKAHGELLAPLLAFEAVRSARGAQLRGVGELKRTRDVFVYLSDPWFTPSLNWLLSRDTKAKIEVRSLGDFRPEYEICCRLVMGQREVPIDASWEEAKKMNDSASRASEALPSFRVEKFVPNATAFAQLLKLVNEGDERIIATASAN